MLDHYRSLKIRSLYLIPVVTSHLQILMVCLIAKILTIRTLLIMTSF